MSRLKFFLSVVFQVSHLLTFSDIATKKKQSQLGPTFPRVQRTNNKYFIVVCYLTIYLM